MAIKPLTGKTSDLLKIVLPACATGKLKAVRNYLDDERKFVSWIGPHGRTMLWEAARKGQLEVVRLLIEDHQADATAFGCYFRETRLEVSPWLVAKINNHQSTAVYLATQDAGMDFLAACYLGDEKFTTKQIDRDPQIANRPYRREHRWNPYAAWPLQYAIVGGQMRITKQLLLAGAKANANPRILFDAIALGDFDSAELLLSGGADPIATQHRDWFESPKFNALARKYGHEIREIDVPPEKWPEIVDNCRGNHNAPDEPGRVRPLIDAGHDVNVRDYKGKTALHRAAQAGFLKITRLLIDSGANLEARSHDEETPIFDAAFYGRVETLRLLVDAGANLTATNSKEESALFAAVRGGQSETLKALLAMGVDNEAVNLKRQTIRDVAARSRKTGIESVRDALGMKKA